MRNGTPQHGSAGRQHRRRVLWVRLGRLASVLFVGAVVILFASTVRTIDWGEVGHAFTDYDSGSLVAAALLAAIGHMAAATYDVAGRRYAGANLSAGRMFAVNFIAYTFSTNLGALVGGWGLRMRLYTRYGLRPRQVLRIIAFSIVSNWSGFVLIGGVVLVLWPPQQLPRWPLSPSVTSAVGVVLLACVGAYLWLCLVGIRRARRATWLDPPGLRTAALQIALSTASWLLLAATLAQLLPPTLPFALLLAVLMLASVVGAVTHLPGNLGILEGTVLVTVGQEFGHTLVLAALIAFRAIYYVGPLLVAAVSYAVLELSARSHRAQAL